MEAIKALIDLYAEDGVSAVSSAKELARQSSREFHQAAGQFLRSATDSTEGERLVRMLLAADLLAPLLCDPEVCSVGEAVTAAQFAMRIDPALDSLLARWLSTHLKVGAAGEAIALRGLAILAEISDGVRIRPVLIQLLRSANRCVRSKAALVIGGLTDNAGWFLDLIRSGDPRVAANAIQGAWNSDWADAREVFLEGLRSPHPRVAGNSIVGLYLLGRTKLAVYEMKRLAAASDPRLRATAAWAMGEVGNTVSVPTLQKLVRDEEAAVRRNALRALARIRNRNKPPGQPAATPADAPAAPPPS